jgi:hypothetical protein
MMHTSASAAWRAALAAFIAPLRQEIGPLPDGHMLSPLAYQQRRITGGSLLHFFKQVDAHDAADNIPALLTHPVEGRVFVCITDLPGAVAAHELIDRASDQAIVLLQREWRAWLEDAATEHDDAFAHHYELWSAWHQEIDPRWELPPHPAHLQLWVHEEGHALADLHGRGAQHVWGWDGHTLSLLAQSITSWSSDDGALGA